VSHPVAGSDDWRMTQTLPSRRADTVTIRGYRPNDHNACRQMWAELASEHLSRYPGHDGGGPGTAPTAPASAASGLPSSAESAPPGPAGLGFTGPAERSGSSDPGAGFEEYLTRLDLSGMWVAQHRDEGVVGFVGLILRGRAGAVDPVVVTAHRRDQGIGRALLEYVAEQARGRGMRELSISPRLRNVEAIHCLFRAGYDTASSVTLTLDLTGRQAPTGDGLDLHGVQFRY
jgi:GNAT superfamily N-acetyltransferase